MDERHIIAGLGTLEGSLRRIKGHVAWIALKESERRPGAPPVLIMDSDLAADIRNEQSFFMATAADILDVLNNPAKYDLPPDRCEEWRNQVLRLETELQKLPIPKTL